FYFKNQFPRKNYISFQLQGRRTNRDPPGGKEKKSNRDAIGALVRIYLGKEVMVRQVQAAGGYLSQSSRNLHFGLGDRRQVERVEIRWPSGLSQTLNNPAINQLHKISEPPE